MKNSKIAINGFFGRMGQAIYELSVEQKFNVTLGVDKKDKLKSDLNLKTGEISKSHQTGKHTTTFAEMYDLSMSTKIIDTPGIKGFGLVELNSNNLCDYFPEFLRLKPKCKFNNCIHVNEPNCNVLKSLENGLISNHRYSNYLSMLENEKNIYRSS